jgi:hypothetical protein
MPRLEGALAAPAPLLKMTCSCQKTTRSSAVRVHFATDLSPHSGRRQTAIALSPGRWRRGQHPLRLASVPAQPLTMVKTMRNTKGTPLREVFVGLGVPVCLLAAAEGAPHPTNVKAFPPVRATFAVRGCHFAERCVWCLQAPPDLGASCFYFLLATSVRSTAIVPAPVFFFRSLSSKVHHNGNDGSDAGAGKANCCCPAHRHGTVA